MMVDFAYVNGMGDDNGDPDHDIHDPDGHCGPVFGGALTAPLRHIGQRNFVYGPPPTATCKLCGATNLKWRAKGDGWVLVENTRVHPGNYKPEHVCPTSADGFEEVE